jgi:hypothetical protein
MQNLLRPYAKAALLEQLKTACEMQGIDLPGRICHRNKNALICFIWENFPEFPRGFPTFSNTPKSHPDKRSRPEDIDETIRAAAAEPALLSPPAPPLDDEALPEPKRSAWEWSSEPNPFSFNLWDDLFNDE